MRLVCLFLGLVTAGLLCGCGTLFNYEQMKLAEKTPSSLDEPRWDYVFGGVKTDLESAKAGIVSLPQLYPVDGFLLMKMYMVLSTPFRLADVPLSLVGDTLTLPKAIEATRRDAKWRQNMKDAENAGVEDVPASSPKTEGQMSQSD